MFKLTIEGSSPADLKSKLLAAASELGGATASNAKVEKPAAAAAPKKPDAPALDYKKDVGPLILKLADKSREKAIALLGQFGVAKGTELKPEQFGEFITAANAAIDVADDLG